VSETPVQPELEDELPEPTEPPKEPFVSKWDIVVFLVLVVVGSGFWMWYKGQGKNSESHFAHADSLYVRRQLPAALHAYRQLRENEQVVSKADDSLLYHRIDSLSELEDHANRLMQGAELAIASKDTGLMRRALDTLSADKTGFVADSSRKHLEAALGSK
jgi:hypothetical protein